MQLSNAVDSHGHFDVSSCSIPDVVGIQVQRVSDSNSVHVQIWIN